MSLKMYDDVFRKVFELSDKDLLCNFRFRESEQWDSVGHMLLCAAMEDTFSIKLNDEDIMNFNSYSAGKSILLKYGIEF